MIGAFADIRPEARESLVSGVGLHNPGRDLMRTGMMLRCLFTRKDLPTLILLTLLMVFSGSLEVFGIGMLFPYVSILEDPSRISETRYLRTIYNALGFGSHRSFLIAISVFLLVAFCFKGVLTLWVTNFQLRFTNAKLETWAVRCSLAILMTLCLFPFNEYVRAYRQSHHVARAALWGSDSNRSFAGFGRDRSDRAYGLSHFSEPGIFLVGLAFHWRAFRFAQALDQSADRSSRGRE